RGYTGAMLLVVDVGNTNTVLGLYDGKELAHNFRIESSKGRTIDEYHVLIISLITLAGVACERVTASIVASVVPALSDPISTALKRAFGHKALVVGPGIKTGMPILYENPREVGADRIVNAIAAFEKVSAGHGCIVVDFGTATTFDCVSNRGEYLGGVIAPGMQISAEALFSRAAKLPRAEIAKPPRAIGRNTVHSMQSGIVFGYVGLVDGLVVRLKGELGYPCRVTATGGLATLIAPESSTIEDIDPNLTLEGLRILYERNVG
ncbi:MAG TPA: type III pantothenate kinase, partial [Polyangiaceae bacterium]|nr:type III pantothenate kinase [Polyangiaceae bacterium]